MHEQGRKGRGARQSTSWWRCALRAKRLTNGPPRTTYLYKHKPRLLRYQQPCSQVLNLPFSQPIVRRFVLTTEAGCPMPSPSMAPNTPTVFFSFRMSAVFTFSGEHEKTSMGGEGATRLLFVRKRRITLERRDHARRNM